MTMSSPNGEERTRAYPLVGSILPDRRADVTADPVAAVDLFKPLAYLSDGAAARYAERFGVGSTPIAAKDGEGARLTFAPPKNSIIY